MLNNRRGWFVALSLALVVALGYVVLERTVFDDGPVGRTKVHLPEDPVNSGSPEPDRIRVYVDNAGPRISISVRTPSKPWSKSLDVSLGGGTEFTIDRGRANGPSTLSGGPPDCNPGVDADPASLITRVSLDRACLPDSQEDQTVTATVRIDDGKAVTAKAAETERPNVLMIMVDDMRTDELRYLPNVQKLLAEKGVTFANGFASFPLCCPARASVLTGLYPHNHGVWSHVPPWGFSSLDDHDTVPVWLQEAGYHTTYLGKYLNGYGSQPEPGRDSGTSTQYCPPGWDLWRGSIDGGLDSAHPDDGGTYRYYDTTLNDNCDGYVPLQGEYQTVAYARLTRDQLEANKEDGRPFFSYVSFTAPHHGSPHEPDDPRNMKTPARPAGIRGGFDDVITQGPGANWHDPDRSDKPKAMRGSFGAKKRAGILEAARQRAEALYIVDQSVQRIVRGLRANGQLDNTVVIFTSDNGYFLGEQGMPQGKVLPYEPSLRVPVIVRGPGIPEGEVRTDPFLSIDYAPTFADLADAETNPDVDGISMLDVARLGDDSPGASWRRVVLTETTPTLAAQDALAAEQPVGARQTEIMLGKVTGIRTAR